MQPYDYPRARWHRKILLHNNKVMRLAIPLGAAAALGWKPGDVLRIEIHDTPHGLSLTKPSHQYEHSNFTHHQP